LEQNCIERGHLIPDQPLATLDAVINPSDAPTSYYFRAISRNSHGKRPGRFPTENHCG
jgi:hypothetical protein